MLWNELSLNTKSEETFAWDTTYDTKPTQIESGFTLSFQRGHGRPDEQVVAGSSRSFSPYQISGGFQLPSKGLILSLLEWSFCCNCRSLVLELSYIYICFGRCRRILRRPQWIARFLQCSLSSVNVFGFTWDQTQSHGRVTANTWHFPYSFYVNA